MAQLTVRINGYAYNVGCEDGQEPHLLAMAEQMERRIDSIKALGGQSGEARLLVLAGLLMADELHDMARELATLRGIAAKNPGALAAAQPDQAPAGAPEWLQERLEILAGRAEAIADGLEKA